MKKETDNDATISESCIIMNITEKLNTEENSELGISVNESLKIPLQNSLKVQSTSVKVKLENDCSAQLSDSDSRLSEDKSPPLSSLGPGAEIKGKICHPISHPKTEDELDEEDVPILPASCGGRLTFFKEGKPLLELSHRTEQGSWVQVKSKTYWPPPSTTAATTSIILHPLRHDTPTTTDDCSSINSSPPLGEHLRKQSNPIHKNLPSMVVEQFYFCSSVSIRTLRRNIKFSRKYVCSEVKHIDFLNSGDRKFDRCEKKCISVDQKKLRLQNVLECLRKKCFLKIDSSVSIYGIFEKVDSVPSENDPFVTPRKRYLRTLETETDSHSKKKATTPCSSLYTLFKSCDKNIHSSPSGQSRSKSAITSQHSSSYSIDALLSTSDAEIKKNESVLRSLLNPDRSKAFGRPARDSSSDQQKNSVGSPYSKESKEFNGEAKKRTDRYDKDLNAFNSQPNFNSLYLNPYFDPRYLMLHNLTTPPPFLQSPGQADVASAVAVAAAAAGYPISPLQLNALTANGGLLPSHYSSPVTASSPHLRSPTPNRASPLNLLPHSPSSKQPAVPPPSPSVRSPLIWTPTSPRDAWTPTSIMNSPMKMGGASPSVSPPPQDAPLNLTKPKPK